MMKLVRQVFEGIKLLGLLAAIAAVVGTMPERGVALDGQGTPHTVSRHG